MKTIFPEPITQFPKADIPIDGLNAYLSQAETHQTLYMHFEKAAELRDEIYYWKKTDLGLEDVFHKKRNK